MINTILGIQPNSDRLLLENSNFAIEATEFFQWLKQLLEPETLRLLFGDLSVLFHQTGFCHQNKKEGHLKVQNEIVVLTVLSFMLLPPLSALLVIIITPIAIVIVMVLIATYFGCLLGQCGLWILIAFLFWYIGVRLNEVYL